MYLFTTDWLTYEPNAFLLKDLDVSAASTRSCLRFLQRCRSLAIVASIWRSSAVFRVTSWSRVSRFWFNMTGMVFIGRFLNGSPHFLKYDDMTLLVGISGSLLKICPKRRHLCSKILKYQERLVFRLFFCGECRLKWLLGILWSEVFLIASDEKHLACFLLL